jgi:hypothetical protein
MPIASIGVEIRVTPEDEIQSLRGKGDYEFVDDRTPFTMRVEDVLREDGVVIGVVGPVIAGPNRYTGLTATLLTRIEGSQWEHDVHSGANFKVGVGRARRVAGFPHYHPDGTEVDGYPQIVRYGSIEVTRL